MAAPVVDPTAAALGLLPGGRGRLLITLAIGAFAIRAIPVLTGGGLQGLHGYDDGVYFGGATALVHGALPYRDFLLLHPPGMVLGLSPFAMLGTLTGDPAAFAVARVSIMVLGAVNAVLVALVAGRYNRLAGFIAGALYAVWSTASNVERTTDLHGPQNTLLLLGLLALARSGRIDPRRAALSGVFLGLAVTVQLWQAVSVVVIVWWVLVRGRGDGWVRLRPAAAYLAGAGIAIGFVCLPFFIAAPEAMIRYLILDQIGRPSVGVDAIDRLRVLEGFAQSAQMPPVLRQLLPDPTGPRGRGGRARDRRRDRVGLSMDASLGGAGARADGRGARHAVVLQRLPQLRRAGRDARPRDGGGCLARAFGPARSETSSRPCCDRSPVCAARGDLALPHGG